MTEAQLALKFIDYLADFDIYKEVPAGGIVDIVAVKGGIRMGIEVKVALNFDVIWQAYQSKSCFHYSYAAVPIKSRPYSRIHPAQEALCKHLGIGVIGYIDLSWKQRQTNNKIKTIEKYEIKEFVKPVLNRHPRKVVLHDYMKRSEAGSQNNRITAFGYFVECLETIVKGEKEGITPKRLFDDLHFKHYKTLSLFKASVVKYCNKGVIKNVDWDGAKFHYIKQKDDNAGSDK